MEDNEIKSIDIGLSLADAQLESYRYNTNENCLNIKIKIWNSILIEFIFSDFIFFVDRGGNFIMDFCINKSETELFQEALQKN